MPHLPCLGTTRHFCKRAMGEKGDFVSHGEGQLSLGQCRVVAIVEFLPSSPLSLLPTARLVGWASELLLANGILADTTKLETSRLAHGLALYTLMLPPGKSIPCMAAAFPE